MHLLFKTITVTGIAVLELWAAIPAGFVFGLPPIIIAIVTIIGGILSSLLVVTIGGHVKNYIQNRRAAKYQQLSTSEQIEMQQRESKKKHRPVSYTHLCGKIAFGQSVAFGAGFVSLFFCIAQQNFLRTCHIAASGNSMVFPACG